MPKITSTTNYLNVQQAADYCGVSASRIYHATSEKEITYSRIFGRIRIDKSDLEDWLARQSRKIEAVVTA